MSWLRVSIPLNYRAGVRLNEQVHKLGTDIMVSIPLNYRAAVRPAAAPRWRRAPGGVSIPLNYRAGVRRIYPLSGALFARKSQSR